MQRRLRYKQHLVLELIFEFGRRRVDVGWFAGCERRGGHLRFACGVGARRSNRRGWGRWTGTRAMATEIGHSDHVYRYVVDVTFPTFRHDASHLGRQDWRWEITTMLTWRDVIRIQICTTYTTDGYGKEAGSRRELGETVRHNWEQARAAPVDVLWISGCS